MNIPNSINFVIQTHTGNIFEEQCLSIVLDTEDGQIEILPGHVSLLTKVLFSFVRAYLPDGTEKVFSTRQGVLFIDNNNNIVTLNALFSVLKESVKHETLLEYHKEVLERLKQGNLTSLQTKFLHEQSESLKVMVEEHEKIL